MFKKYITIIAASLTMLLPTLSSAHHYNTIFEREAEFRQYIHNKSWSSDKIYRINGKAVIKTTIITRLVNYNHTFNPPIAYDEPEIRFTITLNYFDGSSDQVSKLGRDSKLLLNTQDHPTFLQTDIDIAGAQGRFTIDQLNPRILRFTHPITQILELTKMSSGN